MIGRWIDSLAYKIIRTGTLGLVYLCHLFHGSCHSPTLGAMATASPRLSPPYHSPLPITSFAALLPGTPSTTIITVETFLWVQPLLLDKPQFSSLS